VIDTQWKTLAVCQDRTKISQAKLEMAQVNKTTQADQDQFAKSNYELTACFNIPIIKAIKNSPVQKIGKISVFLLVRTTVDVHSHKIDNRK